MAVAALVVIGMGLLLMLVGVVVTVVDWHDERARRNQVLREGHPGADTDDLGLSDTITALQKLMAELSKHPLGTRLIVLGLVCTLIGGVLGGIAGITA